MSSSIFSLLFAVLHLCCSYAEPIHPAFTLQYLNETKHDPTFLGTRHMPAIVGQEMEIIEKEAFLKLVAGLEIYIIENEPVTAWIHPTPFKDLSPAIVLHQKIIHATDQRGNDEKFFVGVDAIKLLGPKFNVYAAGIAGKPVFENYMASLGANVSAFDCTDHKRPNYDFNFYQWCIGTTHSFEGSAYAHGQDTGQQFFTLKEIRQKLGHDKIHMLKMDIEGFEWDLLENEIIHGEDHDLPEQLLFELHTEGANAKWVPPSLVYHKRINEVNELVRSTP